MKNQKVTSFIKSAATEINEINSNTTHEDVTNPDGFAIPQPSSSDDTEFDRTFVDSDGFATYQDDKTEYSI